jgi:fluoride ion exporter CrcB/FEX
LTFPDHLSPRDRMPFPPFGRGMLSAAGIDEFSSTVDRMARLRGASARELAWTAVGAAAGSLARLWVDHMWVGQLGARLLCVAVAAMLVGFAFVASVRAPLKAVLLAAGGAAGSISIVATQAASATAAQALIGLGAVFVCVVPALLLGMLVASSAFPHARQQERR